MKPIAIFPLYSIIMVTWAGCSKPSTEPNNYTYPKATLELLLKEDSTFFSYPVWSRSGSIYYIAHPQDTNPSDLWILNPETASKRLVKQGIEGPIAVSKDGKIALLEDINRLIVVDSTGEVQWQKEIGCWIISLAFSSDNEGIYLCKMENGQSPAHLLFVSLVDSTRIDTILQDAGPFRITQNDSFIVYTKQTSEGGNPIHIFYKYVLATGTKYLILKANYTEGFDINPISPEWLAIGKRGDGNYQFLGRRILLYNMNYGIGRIYEAHPYEESYIYVSSWSPDGEKVLLVVTPYIPGDPIIPFSTELWIAKDIQ